MPSAKSIFIKFKFMSGFATLSHARTKFGTTYGGILVLGKILLPLNFASPNYNNSFIAIIRRGVAIWQESDAEQ